MIGSRSIPGGSALKRWPKREDGRKERVRMSSASCVSSAGMDSRRAVNLANLLRIGVRACDLGFVSHDGDAGEYDVRSCDRCSDWE